MVNLLDFIGKGTKVETDECILMRYLDILYCFSGVFNWVAENAITFVTRIEIPSFTGIVLIHMDVVDDNHIYVRMNGEVDKNAIYTVQGEQLLISATFNGGKKETIVMQQYDNMSYVELSDAFEAKVLFAPYSEQMKIKLEHLNKVLQ